jgi:hypothetical protein
MVVSFGVRLRVRRNGAAEGQAASWPEPVRGGAERVSLGVREGPHGRHPEHLAHEPAVAVAEAAVPGAFGPASSDTGSFDITAQRKPHFGFAGGAHHCLRHLVARSDMSGALPLLARRLTGPRLDGEHLVFEEHRRHAAAGAEDAAGAAWKEWLPTLGYPFTESVSTVD